MTTSPCNSIFHCRMLSGDLTRSLRPCGLCEHASVIYPIGTCFELYTLQSVQTAKHRQAGNDQVPQSFKSRFTLCDNFHDDQLDTKREREALGQRVCAIRTTPGGIARTKHTICVEVIEMLIVQCPGAVDPHTLCKVVALKEPVRQPNSMRSHGIRSAKRMVGIFFIIEIRNSFLC